MDAFSAFLALPADASVEIVMLKTIPAVDAGRIAAFRAAQYTDAFMASVAAKAAELGNKHIEEPGLSLSILQLTNTITLAPGGAKVVCDSLLAEFSAECLRRHTRDLTICFDAGLILKNICLDAQVRKDFGASYLPSLLAGLLVWYPPLPSHPHPVVASLGEAVRVILVEPTTSVKFRAMLLAALSALCSNTSTTELVFSLLVDRTSGESVALARVEDVKPVITALELFAKSALCWSNGMFTLANLFMSLPMLGDMPPKYMVRAVNLVKTAVSLYPTSAQVLLSSAKVLHHMVLCRKLTCGVQEAGGWEPACTIVQASYVTPVSPVLEIVGGIPATLMDAQKISLCCLAQLGNDPRNRVDVPDAVVNLLSTLQASPDSVPSGLSIFVGEAVNNYTRTAPPSTLAKFSAALSAAMDAADQDDEDG